MTKPSIQNLATFGSVLIALGSLTIAGVVVESRAGETARICEHVDRAVTAVVNGVMVKGPATRRASLPPRTPAEQAAADQNLKDTRSIVHDALKEC